MSTAIRPDVAASPAAWPVETRGFVVLAVVVLAAAALLGTSMDAGDQLRVVAVPALLLGLPHGALDPVLARELGLWHDRAGAVRFHLAYLALAGVTVVAFVVAPVVALAVFLATTAWHFSGDQREAAGPVVRVATGAALVSLPAIARPAQVGELYGLVTTPAAAVLAQWQAAAAPVVVAGLVLALVALWRRDRRSFVEVGLAALLAVVVPPLVFFAVHFAALHSPRHLREAMAAAGGGARTAVLYSVMAAGLLGVAGGLLVPRTGVEAAIATTVFVGLAALTTPHMLLVERAQRRAVLPEPSP